MQHKQYTERLTQWAKVRDCIAGEDAIKAKGSTYLPMLTSQEEAGDGKQYENYKLRAQFWGAARRTMQGLVGAVLRKPPAIEGLADDLKRRIESSAGRKGETLIAIAQSHLNDLVSVSRGALLVDKGSADGDPYILDIRAEDVVFWVEGQVRGRTVPVLIALAQQYDVPEPNDPIGTQTKQKPEWRILRLGQPSADLRDAENSPFKGAPLDEPVYWQEIWRTADATTGQVSSDGLVRHLVIVPTKNGGRFWNEIPCDVVNAVGGIKLDCEEPQMLDLANVLLGHYRNSADLEWGRHLTAIPQPWVAGFDIKEGDKLVIGCGYAWSANDAQAKAAYLEFAGSGLGHLADGMKSKEQQAAVLSSRMLEAQPNQAEAEGTVKLRQSGSRSVLATIASNASLALGRAVQRMADWVSPTYGTEAARGKITYTLSTDFDTGQMDPAELTALVAALQAGTMSWETFAWNLRRGEMVPPGVTDEEERARIQKGAPGRSRKDELAMLQADVQAGRITIETYLEQIQKLGMLEGVDLAAELAAAEEAKVRSLEAAAEAFERKSGGGRPNDEPEDEPADKGGGAGAPPKSGGEDDEASPDVSLNELTLGVERLVRAGNIEGANKLLAHLAEMLGEKSLGKVKPAAAAAAAAVG